MNINVNRFYPVANSKLGNMYLGKLCLGNTSNRKIFLSTDNVFCQIKKYESVDITS